VYFENVMNPGHGRKKKGGGNHHRRPDEEDGGVEHYERTGQLPNSSSPQRYPNKISMLNYQN
jgi:hypothetical protein